MKREFENFSSSGSCSSSTTPHMWPCDADDELFAVLGYNVKSSDMADLAQKIQHLEQVMEQDGLSQLASHTTHYNPSDLSSWLQSMISGLDNATVNSPDFDSDLTAIPGKSVCPRPRPQPQPQSPLPKKFKLSPVPTESIVMIDSQENGIRLVHSLMACAEAVQRENFKLAEALVKNIGFLAVSQAGAMRKVATYFAEALARRIYRLYPTNHHDSTFTDFLQMHFYETCPYLKFAHFTANQAILESFAGRDRVHVIDFSMKQGMQWPPLLQALALRPGGPPRFRLTAVTADTTDQLQEVGRKLTQLAETINVEFEYRGVVANSLSDLNAALLNRREGETVAVNSILELHPLLARAGAIEKVLRVIRELKPAILTVVEQEANHNGSVFSDRFTEALHYYSTLFDSLESCDGGGTSNEDKLMSEMYLGRQICNVVACEGAERVERHETLSQWRRRLGEGGFEAVHLGSNAHKQASMLLAFFAGGDGYRVDEKHGCLMLGWHTRPLFATSAWRLAS